MKVLVAGWFSFEAGHATAGDLLARELVCQWLSTVGCEYTVSVAHPFVGGVDWQLVNPDEFSHVVFVCGPFTQGELERAFLQRFWTCTLIGVDLSMQTALPEWNPFDLLMERDSSVRTHPDIVFGTRQPLVPVAGVCLVEDYPEGRTDIANPMIERLVASRSMAVVNIDTRLDVNTTGLRSPQEIEALIARVDVLITTRLHGLVLALKNGVPALAIDPEWGGAKIRKQAAHLQWPAVFDVSQLEASPLQHALEFCLSAEGRSKARTCAEEAAVQVAGLGERLMAALRNPDVLEANRQTRLVRSGPPEPCPTSLSGKPPFLTRALHRWLPRGRQ